MATKVFPNALPKVYTGSYSFNPQSGVVRTEMDSGYARVRRRASQTPTEISVSWLFTEEEFGIFERFFDVDLHGGVAWFEIELYNGAGESTFVARFKEPYAAKSIVKAKMWEVSAKLESMARPLISAL